MGSDQPDPDVVGVSLCLYLLHTSQTKRNTDLDCPLFGFQDRCLVRHMSEPIGTPKNNKEFFIAILREKGRCSWRVPAPLFQETIPIKAFPQGLLLLLQSSLKEAFYCSIPNRMLCALGCGVGVHVGDTHNSFPSLQATPHNRFYLAFV